MNLFVRWSVGLLGLLLASVGAAHEGEAQSVAGAPPAVASKHTMTAVSEHFELVVKNQPLVPHQPGLLELYLSDFATNVPIVQARVQVRIHSKSGGREIWSGAALAGTTPGVYIATIAAADTGALATTVSVQAADAADEFALRGLEVRTVATARSTGSRPRRAVPWMIAFGTLLFVAGIVTVLRRRRRHVPALLVAGLVLCHDSSAPAHEGHDDGPVASGQVIGPGSVVYMTKESQFLLGVTTATVKSESVQKHLRALGRVAPRTGGELDIVAPQSGRIYFPGGRAPTLGETVDAGRVIATLVVIDSLVLRSTLRGIVTEAPLANGQLVSAGQRILRVLDPSVVAVHADVYERDLASVEHSTRATVVSAAYPDDVLIGRRVAVGAGQGEVQGTVEVFFEVPNPRGRLKIDTLVEVEIEQGEATPTLVVPRAALIEREGRTLVFVHTTPEQFAVREVVQQANLGPSLAIGGDLQAGDRVVVAGSYQLFSSPAVSGAK